MRVVPQYHENSVLTVISSVGKKQMKYGEINLEDPPVTGNGNEEKIVEVGKYYKWSF